MASIENSLKYEAEVEPGKVRLITSGEFVRAYNHSAWLFYCCISKYKVIRKFHKPEQRHIYFLGFPTNKLLELLNGRPYEKTDFGYDVALKPEEIPPEDGYETWVKEVPVEAGSRADAFVVGNSEEALLALVPRVRDFLREELALELNEAKVRVIDVSRGVEFLGAFVKPWRTYPANRALRRIRGRMKALDWSGPPNKVQARVNSMLGALSHFDCYQRRRVLVHESGLRRHGRVTTDGLKFSPDILAISKPGVMK